MKFFFGKSIDVAQYSFIDENEILRASFQPWQKKKEVVMKAQMLGYAECF